MEAVGADKGRIRKGHIRISRQSIYSSNELKFGYFEHGNVTMDIMETIKEQVESNRILIYMKGSPEQPQCGFSAQSTQALMACGEKFAYIDILANPEIRANLPSYSDWPTFPQLFVDGELIGGCDIITEMYQNGELQELVKSAAEQNE